MLIIKERIQLIEEVGAYLVIIEVRKIKGTKVICQIIQGCQVLMMMTQMLNFNIIGKRTNILIFTQL